MVITMMDTQYKIKSKKFDIFPLINSVIMILFVIITLYPVLNTLAISLNDGTDALRGGIYLCQPMQSLLLLAAAKDSCSRERFPCSGSSPCM